jgi:hypothetical protein
MNPYITYRDIDSNGELGYFILQRDFPHYIGEIITIPKEGIIPPIQITGYYLWVNFSGTLRGNSVPGYRNIGEDIKFVINDMALWYYANRVIPEQKKYKKFKYDTIPS